MEENLSEPCLRRISREVGPYIHRTPLWHSESLSRCIGRSLFLKAELFQKTGSYKPRGMLWALQCMSEEARAKGVITYSAGNASQGLAYAAKIFGVRAVVVMPSISTPGKVSATEAYGAEVIISGTPSEGLRECGRLAAEHQLTFLSAYDDLLLMQGHASLGLEVIEDLPEVDVLFVPVGGGGMLGGIVMAAQALNSKAEIIGVEPRGAAAMHESMRRGTAVQLEEISTIAEGLAAPGAGITCFEITRQRVSDVVLVEDTEIVEAMLLLMSRTKLVVEPAGAASFAGLLKTKSRLPANARVACILSGGNLEMSKLPDYLALQAASC